MRLLRGCKEPSDSLGVSILYVCGAARRRLWHDPLMPIPKQYRPLSAKHVDDRELRPRCKTASALPPRAMPRRGDELPAYKSAARSITFLTFDTCQRPPRAVRTPQAFRLSANPRRSATPFRRRLSMIGQTDAANASADAVDD
jgi:hypothetical protein